MLEQLANEAWGAMNNEQTLKYLIVSQTVVIAAFTFQKLVEYIIHIWKSRAAQDDKKVQDVDREIKAINEKIGTLSISISAIEAQLKICVDILLLPRGVSK